MDTTYQVAEVRNNFSSLVAQVERTHERIKITKHGREVAILVSPVDLEELEKTIEFLLSDEDRSEILKNLRLAEAAVTEGRAASLDDLTTSLRQRGIIDS